MIIGFVSCEKYEDKLTEELRKAERIVLGVDEDGNTSKPSYCTDIYSGPEGDIQVTSYCMTAYNYVCNGGYDPESSEIRSICDTYDTMREGTSLPSCPYCK